VIDDDVFTYKTLFKRDGYTIDKWNDVTDLTKLETGYYDIILLDIQGVGQDLSKEQGLGILKHLRQVNPTQIIIAYSNADWSLQYQEFFKLADATLAKNADYVDFKRIVDDLLQKRFTISFYLDKVVGVVKDDVADTQHIRQLAEKAILSRSTEKLEKYLKVNLDKAEAVTAVISIIKSVMSIAASVMK
jgi:CheY-like chemotaxis protein